MDLVRAMNRVERRSPIRGTCLSRSLALKWLLARQGIQTVVRLGGAISDGQFEAHAWLELDGAVLGSPADVASRFVMFQAAPTTSPSSAATGGGVSAR
jgi:hypothetical protein